MEITLREENEITISWEDNANDEDGVLLEIGTLNTFESANIISLPQDVRTYSYTVTTEYQNTFLE